MSQISESYEPDRLFSNAREPQLRQEGLAAGRLPVQFRGDEADRLGALAAISDQLPGL